jgi:hypothetical protein
MALAACVPVEPASTQNAISDPEMTETAIPDPTEPEPTETQAATAENNPVDSDDPAWPETFLPVRDHVAEALGIPVTDVHYISAEEATFRDSCLDAPRKGENCLQVITPGYRVTVNSPQGKLVFHMNQAGTAIRLSLGTAPVELTNPDA